MTAGGRCCAAIMPATPPPRQRQGRFRRIESDSLLDLARRAPTNLQRSASYAGRLKNQRAHTMRIIAIILIALGALALIYGGFSYTQDKTAAKLGPIELNVKETKTVPIPLWAGIAGIVVGGALLATGGRR
jgi:hypothetical protein